MTPTIAARHQGASPYAADRCAPACGPLATPQAETQPRNEREPVPGDALLRAVAAPWLMVPTPVQGPA